MACSDHFADQLHLILDPKALDKKNAPSYEEMMAQMGEGDMPPPATSKPETPSAWTSEPPPNPYAARANTAPTNPYAKSAAPPSGVPMMPPGALAPINPVPGGYATGGYAPPQTPMAMSQTMGSPTSPPGLEGFQPLPPGEYYFRPKTSQG